jgi:hypothetical protein
MAARICSETRDFPLVAWAATRPPLPLRVRRRAKAGLLPRSLQSIGLLEADPSGMTGSGGQIRGRAIADQTLAVIDA